MQRNILSIVAVAILFIAMVVMSGCMTGKSRSSYGGAVGSNDKPSCEKSL